MRAPNATIPLYRPRSPFVREQGRGYDDALAKTIHRLSWLTRESLELATLQWVSWFNHQRLLGTIGYIPPIEAAANDSRQYAPQATTVQT